MRLPHTRAESAVGAASLRSLSGRCTAGLDDMDALQKRPRSALTLYRLARDEE